MAQANACIWLGCTWELCSGGGDLLKVQPGHSIGTRKLWNAGALTVIHPCLLVSFTYNEFLFKLHLFQDDGEPEAGQSVQGWACNRGYESGFA